jgi:hypothetical protein
MKLGVTIAAIASLAVGGSAIATAAQKGGTPPPAVSTIAPVDTSAASDGDNVQQADQSAADAGGAAEAPDASGDSSAESSAASDGPGGYADPAGNADTQQQGEH